MTQPDYAAIAREITNYGQVRVESILRKHFEPVVEEVENWQAFGNDLAEATAELDLLRKRVQELEGERDAWKDTAAQALRVPELVQQLRAERDELREYACCKDDPRRGVCTEHCTCGLRKALKLDAALTESQKEGQR